MVIQKQSEHSLKHMQISKLKTIYSKLPYIGQLNMGIQKQSEHFIEAHANIEAQDNLQQTPLHMAAANGHSSSNQSTY